MDYTAKRLNKLEKQVTELRKLLGRVIDVLSDLVTTGKVEKKGENKSWGILKTTKKG